MLSKLQTRSKEIKTALFQNPLTLATLYTLILLILFQSSKNFTRKYVVRICLFSIALLSLLFYGFSLKNTDLQKKDIDGLFGQEIQATQKVSLGGGSMFPNISSKEQNQSQISQEKTQKIQEKEPSKETTKNVSQTQDKQSSKEEIPLKISQQSAKKSFVF